MKQERSPVPNVSQQNYVTTLNVDPLIVVVVVEDSTSHGGSSKGNPNNCNCSAAFYFLFFVRYALSYPPQFTINVAVAAQQQN